MKNKFIRFLIFMVIWVTGCTINEYFLKIDIMAWVMAYGFAVGCIAHTLPLAIVK
jgi:hypothetical protein